MSLPALQLWPPSIAFLVNYSEVLTELSVIILATPSQLSIVIIIILIYK